MSITIKDIASTLGISPSTVSRALNGHPDISEKTRKSVKDLAKKMNYQVNQMASGLRTKRSFTIGVLVPKIASHFFSSALSGIQEVAVANNYQVLICQTNESQNQERKYVKSLLSAKVDGFLISLAKGQKTITHIKAIVDNKVPLVFFDRISDSFNVPKIEAEDFKGAHRAVTHLIDTGCRKIVHLAGPDNLTASYNRMQGYKQALKDKNIPIDEKLIIPCDFDPENAKKAIHRLMGQNGDIDGIFTVNDELGVEAILTLKSMNIKVPDQVSVVGFGDFPICRIVEPNLTSIRHNPYQIGLEAAQCLFSQINHKNIDGGSRRVIPSELVVRDSSKTK
ncbi:LacI family transcriptional regulator [Fulvivirga imtechensis AK7]|uniref:LacI family transcriptional regulator n=1 Tax=Fulvivirga imtechensis AK7 TaxID=1237149 RepID=L8JJH8_9BACT|nr:LacI family DNA-binding transcriptional regulator [Fulvivirga imtechensis]ELR69061.1 LacI family transcriptional regulator [Fulvivirga imtechensis AK7]